jgi:hypothetical protein
MPSSGRSLLALNNDPLSSNYFGGNEIDKPSNADWVKSRDYVIEQFDHTPTQNLPITWGDATLEVLTKFNKRADKVQHLDLIYDRTALSGTATGAYFDDFEAYSSIDYIQFKYNTRVLWQVYGDQMKLNFHKTTTPEERSIIAKMQGGYLTKAARIARAAVKTQVVLRIPHPFRKLHKMLNFNNLPSDLEIKVVFKPLSQCINNSSGTPASTLSDFKIRAHWLHKEQDQRVRDYKISRSSGFQIKTLDYNFHRRVQITSSEYNSAMSKSIKLDNIKQDIIVIRGCLRNARDVDTSSTLNQWNYLKLPKQVYIKDGGVRIFGDVQPCYGSASSNSTYRHLQNYTGELENATAAPLGDPSVMDKIFEIKFCLPEKILASEDGCYGSKRFSNMSNPELYLEWDTAPSDTAVDEYGYYGTIYLDLYAEHHQIVTEKGGDLKRFVE